jgi:hypothetical protein
VLLLASEAVCLGKTTPRLWTRPLIQGPAGPCGCGCALTRDDTFGYAVDDFATLIGRPLDPWQRWLVIHAMELLPNGWPRFRQVVVLVARQNGKTELLVILSLFWMWVQQVGMVLGTSTKLDYSRESWMKAVTLARKSPDLCGDISARGSVRNANGEQEMVTPWGSRYKIAAANEEGGRSLTVNRLVEDELRQHHDWTAHTAANNAMNAVSDAQAWAITNEGDDRSVVLHSFYDAALGYINTGEGDRRLGLFAWSSPPGCDLLDVEATAQANPNLGRRIQWESLEGEAIRAKDSGGEIEAKYRTEVLCQRVDRLKDSPISLETWAATAQDVRPTGLPVFFVAIAKEMRSATVCTAAMYNGVPHVGIAGHAPGTAWLTAHIKDLRERYPSSVFGAYAAGPVRSWVPAFAEFGLELRLLTAPEAVAGCAHLHKLSDGAAFTHTPSPVLTESLQGAELREMEGGGWVWDWRNSTGDLAPLSAATGALWLLESSPSYDLLSSVY